MGWIESPPYFGTASETGRDLAEQHAERRLGTLENHKFIAHTEVHEDFQALPATCDTSVPFQYMIEAFVDDYMSIAVARSQQQLRHVANAIMHGINDVFPVDDDDNNDSSPIGASKMAMAAASSATKLELQAVLMHTAGPCKLRQ